MTDTPALPGHLDEWFALADVNHYDKNTRPVILNDEHKATLTTMISTFSNAGPDAYSEAEVQVMVDFLVQAVTGACVNWRTMLTELTITAKIGDVVKKARESFQREMKDRMVEDDEHLGVNFPDTVDLGACEYLLNLKIGTSNVDLHIIKSDPRLLVTVPVINTQDTTVWDLRELMFTLEDNPNVDPRDLMRVWHAIARAYERFGLDLIEEITPPTWVTAAKNSAHGLYVEVYLREHGRNKRPELVIVYEIVGDGVPRTRTVTTDQLHAIVAVATSSRQADMLLATVKRHVDC